MILLIGEVTSKGKVDLQTVVRNTVKKIGYDDSSKGKDVRLMCLTSLSHCILSR